MTREEAIRILDPKTTGEALAEIEYYHGFAGKTAAMQAVSDACMIAVAAMRKLNEIEHATALVAEIPEEDAVQLRNEIRNGRIAVLEEGNRQLTIEELREMDGAPVWVEYPEMGLRLWVVLEGERYMGVVEHGRPVKVEGIHFSDGRTFRKSAYGREWFAYLRKPLA